MIRRLVPLEHDIQAAFFQWVKLAEKANPTLRLMFAVPNAGKRSYKTAAMMIAEGLRKGVPDMILPVPRNGFTGLAIEFKRPGETPRPEQLAYIALLVKEHWLVVVLTDSEAAIKTVKSYLGLM